MSYKAAVLTASDKGYAGQRKDKSGPLARQMLQKAGYEVLETALLPDDETLLREKLRQWCESGRVDLVLTTGGTGLSPRDVTPEATLAIADKNVPGIAEALRAYSTSITPRAMLSRAVSVVCRRTLIINLPGSPKAVEEELDFLLPQLPHALGVLTGREEECARPHE